ncbi:MAG: DivIVA domain-containing protein [Ruminococcaceae bacterium]|nr:DivIVA domain-containing protein [Oscillospiraceae bacterium]
MKALAETYFNKTFKGYDTAQVDEFITSLSDTYEKNTSELNDRLRAAEAENERLRSEILQLHSQEELTAQEHREELLEKQKEYDALCAEIGEKMVVADKRAAEIIKNAEKEASLIITQAQRSSENEARAIRTRAEEDANRLIEETRSKCESISAAAEEFRARQNEMNRSMLETENRFASALNKLREDIGEE